MDELVGVGFFSEVEVGRDGVFEEMDEQVPEQDEESGMGTTELNALRHHLDQRRGQHEARTQRNKIAQIGALPVFLNNDGSAKDVRGSRGEPQQHTGQDGGHEEKGYQERSCEPRALSPEPRTESLPGAE